jgi:hypothetical protein
MARSVDSRNDSPARGLDFSGNCRRGERQRETNVQAVEGFLFTALTGSRHTGHMTHRTRDHAGKNGSTLCGVSTWVGTSSRTGAPGALRWRSRAGVFRSDARGKEARCRGGR